MQQQGGGTVPAQGGGAVPARCARLRLGGRAALDEQEEQDDYRGLSSGRRLSSAEHRVHVKVARDPFGLFPENERQHGVRADPGPGHKLRC